MRLSQRMARLGTETAFEVLARAKALEAQGRSIVHLEIGEPDFDTPGQHHRGGDQGAAQGRDPLRPLGRPARSCARRSPRTRPGGAASEATPEMVVVTPGGKPIMFFAILALVDEGDEVLYPNPGFPIYESMIHFIGGKPVPRAAAGGEGASARRRRACAPHQRPRPA